MKKQFFLLSIFYSFSLMANTLTLNDAIDKTMQNHPDIKSFDLKVKQSNASYKSAYSAYLPQINLTANYNATQTYAVTVNNTFKTIDDDGLTLGATLNQKIYDFSKTSSLIKASKIDEKISKLSLEDLQASLVYEVKSFYQLMVLKSEAIKVRQKDLDSKVAYYEQAQALVKEGLKTQADASRFLSAVYLAKNNLYEAKAEYEKAKNSLSLYMGEDIEDGVELQTNIIKQDANFDKNIVKEILDTNYDLKISDETIQKNILLRKSAKASHYGSVDAVASYNYIDNLNSYDSKLVGVSLNIPLYSGGKLSAESQKAEIASQIAKEQKASKILALREQIESLLIDIKRYNKTIQAKKAELEASQETKKVLDARYEEGLSTYIEVLDASSLVLNAKLSVLEAYYQKAMSINKIIYLKGKAK